VINLIKLLVALVILTLGAGLATLNEGEISLNYYFGTMVAPLPLALLGAMGVGLVLGFIAGLTLWAKVRRENAKLRRSARLAQEEVNNLRALPLKQH
jgi:putative membrane protein